MLADRFPPRSAGLPISILDNVALDTRRLHPNAKTGERGIPNDIVLSPRGEFVDRGLRQSLLRHGIGRSSGKRRVSRDNRNLPKSKVLQWNGELQKIAIYQQIVALLRSRSKSAERERQRLLISGSKVRVLVRPPFTNHQSGAATTLRSSLGAVLGQYFLVDFHAQSRPLRHQQRALFQDEAVAQQFVAQWIARAVEFNDRLVLQRDRIGGVG
jgi:hypothetical protein